MRKYDFISALAQETAKEVVKNRDEWMKYLTTAARLYKYPFREQLLIYAQRPDATACASIELWNERMHCWVNKGAKGIALLDEDDAHGKRLKYVFDVSDVHAARRIGRYPELWELHEEHKEDVIRRLEQTYGATDDKKLFEERLMEIAERIAADYYEELLPDLQYMIEGSFLEGLDEQNVGIRLRDTLSESISFTLLSACGADMKEYGSEFAFDFIQEFNSMDTLAVLGDAVNELAKPVLLEIGRTIRAYNRSHEQEQLQNLTQKGLANTSEIDCNALKHESESGHEEYIDNNQNSVERGNSDESGIRKERGLSDPDIAGGHSAGGNGNEVRNDEGDLSEGEPQGRVLSVSSERDIERTPADDPEAGRGENGEADKPDGGNRGSDRTAQGNRSDALGSEDEQHSEPSRGSGIERTGIQPVTDTPLRREAPEPTFTQLSLFPSFEEQVGTVAAAEASMKYTMPAAFSLPQNELETILRSGGGKQHSRKRIFAKYTEGRNAEQMVDFLKNEYGQTGKGFEINGNPVSVWFDEHGMSVGYGTQARETPIVTMDWEEVENHIRSMIENGTYMSANEAFLVDTQERNRVANQIYFFLRDGMDEMPEELGLKAGNYPESEAKLMELLSTHEGREQLKNILEDAANRLASGEAELKWRHVKSPEYLLSEIADLDRERLEFPLPDEVEVAQEDFITQDEIDYAFGRGSGYEHGAFRIYEYFMEGHDQKEAVAFLKNEYGIGGGSGGLPGNDDSHNEHDGKGIRLEKGSYGNPYAKVLLNWNVVEKRLRELIHEDKYLSPQGKENYKAYKEEQAEKARQRELSRLEHGQRLECKKDIDALIAEKFNGFVLPRNTADEIIDKYGIDCVEIVLANTITHFDYDGRFSQNNKDWAKGIVAENEWQNNDLILSSHPAVLDGFTNQARRYINVLREKEKEAQQKITIDGYECVLVDEWGSEKEKYLLGNNIEDSSFYYAQVNGKTFEYDHKPERSEVEDDYINAIAEEDIDRHEAEVFSRFEGTDGIAEPDETEPQQEFSQEKSQKLSWHVVHDADDEYGNPTQWSATLSEGVFLWIDKEAEGYAIYDTADTTRPALETFSTLQEAMDWGNELAESGREAETEFSDEREQTEDELDSIDTQFARERLENGEADRQTEEMLSQVLTGDWEPLTPSSEEKQPASERQSAQERSVSAPDKSNAVNFHISDDRLGEGSPKEKFQTNIAAIKMLEQIEGENRYATPEEQQVLSQYVGWGGLADAFDESKSNWSAEYHQLKELLSPDEYRMARESTLNAHYTSPVIIHQMYETLEKMGFSKGNVLEPSMGIGNFFGMMPDSMKESRLYGVELDSITGRIAKQLYPQADVQIKGFEKTDYPNDFFDLAIGNVPFGQYKVADKQYDKNNFLIHDYFFAKTLDKVRPGGVVAFITSKGTMDKASPEVRRYLAQRADLLGAVRLPNTAFKANAGTEVTSDILFFQKRDRMVEREPDWVHLGEDANGITMNAYFAEHPEQIVGKMEMVSGPYGMESTCKADDGRPFDEQLAKALQNITGQIDTIDLDEELADEMSRQSIPADPSVKNFSYTVVDNEVYYRENSVMKAVEVSDTAKERIKGMVAMRDIFQTPEHLFRRDTIGVQFSGVTGEWNVKGKNADFGNTLVNMTYGTSRVNAYKILEDSLNLKDTRVYDTIEEDGKEKRVLNKKETMIASQKQEAIREAFKDWVFRDPERRQTLVAKYNELFNSTRPREYDGSHLKFPGMTPDIELKLHQKNAVAHVLYGDNTLLAHCVGSGKTFEMTAAAMESKRLGLCQKSLFVVPNHLTEQWASDFLRLYPGANILAATKKDFEPANRKKFCSHIATGDYDAVIIGHSQFEKIPLSQERQAATIERQIDEIELAIEQAKKDNGERYTIKQMEKSRKALQVRLDKLNDQSRKDNVVTFEQLGVDRLFVDESHNYKNLFLYTKMRNVAGIAQTEAQKSSDMFAKCQYLDEITGGKGVTFATGTPISNSMTELYTNMRYLQYGTLQKLGLGHFDAWAASFGETQTAIELAPEGTGYRAKTRFAKFFNLPELIALFKESADIQTLDMLKLPVPEAEYENVVLKPSEFQKEMVASLGYELCVPEPPEVTEIVDGSCLVRIKPMTKEQREMSEKCVQGLGYQGNNLLCSNWDTDHMEKLDYSGMYEYLFAMKYHKAFDAEDYPNGIPKEEFESLIMEYLPVTAEQIREYAEFDEKNQTYYWARLGCLNYAPVLLFYLPMRACNGVGLSLADKVLPILKIWRCS